MQCKAKSENLAQILGYQIWAVTHHHPHHIIIIIHRQLTHKWKAQTRGPLDTPAQVIRLVRGPYPTDGSTLGSWF